jgi:hypothetical protein
MKSKAKAKYTISMAYINEWKHFKEALECWIPFKYIQKVRIYIGILGILNGLNGKYT